MRQKAVRVRRQAVVVLGVTGLAAGLLTAAPPASAAPDPGMSVAPMPVTAVPLAQAGAVAVWGDDQYQQLTVPPALLDVAVTQVALGGSGVLLALTADGRVVGWGANQARLQRVPDNVAAADVAQVAIDNGYAGAVTRDGRVLTWGPSSPAATPLNVPAGLTGVTQLDIGGTNAVALKADGTVVAWGKTNTGVTNVPSGLTARALVAGSQVAYALTTNGTVVGWGNNAPAVDLPVAVRTPGNVTAVATCGSGVGVALLADHSLVMWDRLGDPLTSSTTPSNLVGVSAASVAGRGSNLTVVGTDGTIRSGSCGTQLAFETPPAVNGRAVAHVAAGWADSSAPNGAVIITALRRGVLPRVSGTAKPGGVLTGTAGTFSGSPDAITNQWLADGAPIAGASGPTLAVTPAMVGKTISYRSTATKAGVPPMPADAVAMTVTEDNPPKVKSSTQLAKVKVAKKAAKVTVSGKVTATAPPGGKAVVTIAKGKKTIVTKSVSVSGSGKLSLTIKKFGKLAIKKTKSKSKTGYRGTYTVTVKYAGNAQVLSSADTAKFKVT